MIPFAQLVSAVRTAGNRAGTLRCEPFAAALARAAATPAEAAVLRARLVHADVPTTRELELEISASSPATRQLAGALAGALSVLPEESAVVARALLGISAASAAVLYAHVPWSSVFDATLLQACRTTGAAFEQHPNAAGRGESLVLHVARALSLPVGGLDESALANRLAELDPEAAAARARASALEEKLRAALPKV
jgi:hypothetical protein